MVNKQERITFRIKLVETLRRDANGAGHGDEIKRADCIVAPSGFRMCGRSKALANWRPRRSARVRVPSAAKDNTGRRAS
jgi:hypothetical protein